MKTITIEIPEHLPPEIAASEVVKECRKSLHWP